MKTRVNLGENSYDILIEKNSLSDCSDLFSKYGRVLVVTDSGVPKEYPERVADCTKGKSVMFVMPKGEKRKNINTITRICQFMLDNDFSRKDCVCAVGGGVVGDVAAFAASIYMRGIDFYNVPTTLLSMVDSSSGGKTVSAKQSFGNDIPYLQSVVAYDDDMPKNGHGVGMTQHGAKNLAKMGNNAYQILTHFYNNIQFAKLNPVYFK